jgi:methionyl-tRNA formyltransferase
VKIIFAGTPETAVPTLEALIKSGHEIVAVLTRPDAPVGRRAVLTPSAVASFAESHDLLTIKTKTVDSAVTAQLADLESDLGVVVAYGAFLPTATLELPMHGWVNLHFSRLPELRGAAPVQWTLINGYEYAATTVFRLVEAMDAGPIASIEQTKLSGTETASELLATLAESGAQQVVSTVQAIESGTEHFAEQQGVATFAPKLSIEEGHLDPNLDANTLFNRFRGVSAEPGAWILIDQNRIKIRSAKPSDVVISPGAIELQGSHVYFGTVTTALELLSVQPAGKQTMNAADWARGRR